MIKSDVFQRSAGAIDEMEGLTPAVYNLVLGMVLVWGFALNYMMVRYIPVALIENINPLVFFLAYFGSCLAGIAIFRKSSNPVISFIGYNFIVIPFGFIINLIVSQYDSTIVLDAVRITGFVTLLMMVLGTAFPTFFVKIRNTLFFFLLGVIIIEAVEVFIFNVHHGIIDWIVALIFCGYIGYDWARANAIPKTMDNAVDSAAAIYIDIINLFLRILRILGRGKRRR
ncbi:MAG: US12 family protein [Anaerolineaceae bacterium]|nr:US12 family protein [Anaerolineaceae bacterium]